MSVELLAPRLTVVNSTVAIGTTRAIAERSDTTVVYSPIRGKHARMLEELTTYVKFIGDSGQMTTRGISTLSPLDRSPLSLTEEWRSLSAASEISLASSIGTSG